MIGTIIFLVSLAYVSGQYGAQQPVRDIYPPPYVPNPIPPNPFVIPIPVGPSPSTSSSEERSCGRCKYLKTSCEGVPKKMECHEAKIKNYVTRYGCKSAIVSCGPSKQPITLETSDGKILGEGINIQKLVKCGKREKWCTRDINDDLVNFRTVRCVVRKRLPPPRPHPPPPPPIAPSPTPQPIAG